MSAKVLELFGFEIPIGVNECYAGEVKEMGKLLDNYYKKGAGLDMMEPLLAIIVNTINWRCKPEKKILVKDLEELKFNSNVYKIDDILKLITEGTPFDFESREGDKGKAE